MRFYVKDCVGSGYIRPAGYPQTLEYHNIQLHWENQLKKKSKKVPKEMQDIYLSITKITDEFSQQYLNDEYAEFIQYAVAELSRKRPSPLLKGKHNIWACAITHAIGVANFLDDSSQTPYVKASKLYDTTEDGVLPPPSGTIHF